MQNNNNPKDFNDVDGLSITENDDGTFEVQWDENDPRYSMFKGLTEEQIQVMITEGLREIINREADDDEGW
tara:strand:+ start:1052 stop:1264 length:213 start_codon:yes stop_codon:yes gene_type:complete